jgi:hypothetical protein
LVLKKRAHLQQKKRNGGRLGVTVRYFAILAAGLALAAPVMADDLQFSTPLDPVAFDNSSVKNNVGNGSVAATLSGNALTITGTYAGLSSEAIDAHMKMGLAEGVPGPVIGDLKVSGGMQGQLSGTVKLSSAQIAALKKGAISVVVDSAKAPDGNLWGWLSAP